MKSSKVGRPSLIQMGICKNEEEVKKYKREKNRKAKQRQRDREKKQLQQKFNFYLLSVNDRNNMISDLKPVILAHSPKLLKWISFLRDLPALHSTYNS